MLALVIARKSASSFALTLLSLFFQTIWWPWAISMAVAAVVPAPPPPDRSSAVDWNTIPLSNVGPLLRMPNARWLRLGGLNPAPDASQRAMVALAGNML